jgi:CDGSH-type Zn-finger protein
MSQVTITVKKNGSLRIDDPNGVIEMVDGDGNKYDLTGKPAFSLCRCGASANRPFCDGSHKRIEFQAPDCAIKPPEPAATTAATTGVTTIAPAIKTGQQPG